MNHPAGFREIEHTADWELEAWAPDLPALLEMAARGMYELSGTRLQPSPRQTVMLNLAAADSEELLVNFLSELLYWGELQGLGFDQFQLSLSPLGLQAQLEGAPIASIEKEIKAVTYHNLTIQKGERGLEVRIVFDV